MQLQLQQVVLQVYPQTNHGGQPLHSRGADNRAEPFENDFKSPHRARNTPNPHVRQMRFVAVVPRCGASATVAGV